MDSQGAGPAGEGKSAGGRRGRGCRVRGRGRRGRAKGQVGERKGARRRARFHALNRDSLAPPQRRSCL